MVKRVKESPATPSSSSSSTSASFVSTSFGFGLICIGSLLSLLGGTCLLFFYPSECVLTDPAITCSTSEVLTVGGIIVFFCSGASMMLCGLAMLCYFSEDEEEKLKNASKSKGKKYTASEIKRASEVPSIHCSSNSIVRSTLSIKNDRISHIIYYPPPSYYDPNLVYGCQTNTLKSQQLENPVESQA